MSAAPVPQPAASAAEPLASGVSYVTVRLAEQLFGLPIETVQDVFVVPELTRVPLAPPEVAGLLNLRGRVVTAIDLRCRLGLPPAPAGKRMAVGIEQGGEAYGLVVDAVGEVMHLTGEGREELPVHLDPRWAAVAAGVRCLPSELLVILDVAAVLDPARSRFGSAEPPPGDAP